MMLAARFEEGAPLGMTLAARFEEGAPLGMMLAARLEEAERRLNRRWRRGLKKVRRLESPLAARF